MKIYMLDKENSIKRLNNAQDRFLIFRSRHYIFYVTYHRNAENHLNGYNLLWQYVSNRKHLFTFVSRGVAV